MRVKRLLASCLLCAMSASANSLPAAANDTAARAAETAAQDAPWYRQPNLYYLVGGVLFTAGLATGFGTDGCQEPYDARCRRLMIASQATGFPGMALIGAGLWLQFFNEPESSKKP
jgi:hypothetical protein